MYFLLIQMVVWEEYLNTKLKMKCKNILMVPKIKFPIFQLTCQEE